MDEEQNDFERAAAGLEFADGRLRLKQTPPRRRLWMTVGLPRSGKSSWACAQGFPIVSPDAIRGTLHGGGMRREAERMVWAIAHTMVASLFEAGHTDVILDATNNIRRYREEWVSSQWLRIFVVFTASADECISRAMALGQVRLPPVIERMAAAHEPISADEEWLEFIVDPEPDDDSDIQAFLEDHAAVTWMPETYCIEDPTVRLFLRLLDEYTRRHPDYSVPEPRA